MTAHELARQLLEMPDLPVHTEKAVRGNHGIEDFEISDISPHIYDIEQDKDDLDRWYVRLHRPDLGRPKVIIL